MQNGVEKLNNIWYTERNRISTFCNNIRGWVILNNIVEHGMKIDLHIHSCISAHKDGKKVKNNTKENIPILVQKLNENQVNICALTDHDAFSYDI